MCRSHRRLRLGAPTVVAAALAVLAALPAAVPAAWAEPGSVTSAQAQVDALAAEEAQASTRLSAGSQRLAEGQARLDASRAEADRTRSVAEAAQARARAARDQLGQLVNAAYRTPLPDVVTLALGAAPGGLQDAVLAGATIDHVRDGQQTAVEVARDAREVATALSARADGLRDRADAEARALEAEVAALAAQARDVQARLDVAAAALEQARAREAAAAAAAATAAAARAAAAARVPAPAPVQAPSRATCTGGSAAGSPNGYLPASALCALQVAGGHRLRADAAAAFNRMTAAYPLCVTDSYRSYAAQVDVYARKPSLAAVPGTSNHGLGLALDLCGGVETFGSPAYTWLKAHAGQYGFVHPAWAEPGGGKPEPWHWEYTG